MSEPTTPHPAPWPLRRAQSTDLPRDEHAEMCSDWADLHETPPPSLVRRFDLLLLAVGCVVAALVVVLALTWGL